MKELYEYYAAHPDGEWNANGGVFTVADFLAWILMIESKGNIVVFEYNMEVYSRQLWGTGYNSLGALEHVPYCPSSPCVNGVLNFLGAYSQSGPGRYSALMAGDFAAVEQNPANYENYAAAGYTVGNTGRDVVINPKWTEYNNDVPTQTGNYKDKEYGPPWVVNMCMNTQMYNNARDGIVYKFEGENGWFVVIYTLNQANWWTNHKSQDCPR